VGSRISYHFGPFVLDTARRELLKHGTRIKLRGRSYSLLEVLLSRAGEIVTREELQAKLWSADTFVDFEHGLNTSVKTLRQALCDSAEAPRYIETIPRLGYRLIVPVEIVETARPLSDSGRVEALPDVPPVPAKKVPPVLSLLSRHWRVATAASIALGAAIALSLTIVPILLHLAFSRSPAKSGGTAMRFTSIAVLPLENLSNDPTQDYFSDGMTDELITDLSQLAGLRVVSRSSITRYKGSKKAVPEIGRELAVDGVIRGSVERVGDRVRIRVQLIDAANDRSVWTGSYDREMKDASLLEGTLARDMAKEIMGEAAPKGHPHVANMEAIPSDAYQAYLEGRYFWNKRTAQGFQQATEYFQQAIAKDPGYAKAYAGLADSYAMAGSYDFSLQSELMPKARAAALKALEIDDKLAEAHTSLAVIAQDYDWDWQTSERQFRQAIADDPNYATAHHWYAEHLALEGRFPEAFAEIARARELDPLSLIIGADDGAILYFSRQYDRAIKQLRAVLDMEPNFPRAHIVIGAYIEEGRFAEALADIKSWRRFEDSPWARAMEVYVCARSGNEVDAENGLKQLQLMNQRQAIDPIDLVFAYVGLNDKNHALAWLQRACSQHSPGLTALKVDPLYDPLRSDPRFHAALRRVGLAE